MIRKRRDPHWYEKKLNEEKTQIRSARRDGKKMMARVPIFLQGQFSQKNLSKNLFFLREKKILFTVRNSNVIEFSIAFSSVALNFSLFAQKQTILDKKKIKIQRANT